MSSIILNNKFVSKSNTCAILFSEFYTEPEKNSVLFNKQKSPSEVRKKNLEDSYIILILKNIFKRLGLFFSLFFFFST